MTTERVSKAILDAAGPTVEDECNVLGGQSKTGMIMTKPGNLRCQKIIHVSGSNDPQYIQQTVKDVLVLVEQNRYTSISFPALGTGQGNAQVDQVADAMLDAVADVVAQSAQSFLKVVRIVIFQPAMMKGFHSRMVKKADSDKQNSGYIGRFYDYLWSKVQSAKPQKDEVFVFDGPQIEFAHFHICGSSQAQVKEAIKWITNLILKEHIQTPITDKTIHNLSKEDYLRIGTIQCDRSVKVTLDREHACINIEGLTRNVHAATTEIHALLKKVKDDEDIKKLLETVDWQYQLQGGQFQSFDNVSKFQLEEAYQNNQPCVDVHIQGRVYKVNVPNGPATDNQGNSLEIKRYDMQKDAVNLPKNWEPMPTGTTYEKVLIQPNTPEYNEVLQLFQATCKQTVIQIERIQNVALWKSIQIKKEEMKMKNGHQNNERRLFHGACHTTLSRINQNGFNRSFSGKNGAEFGNGTYFAVIADDSLQYCKPDDQGQKFMYLCCVLTGDFTKGDKGMVMPPVKTPPSLMYDSTVDNDKKPQMFAIFHDSQSYPEYLITFK